MNMPKLTIIMMSYFHENCIERAINSILAQTYNDWELLIADDCSQDNTVNIVNKYVNQYDGKIRLITNEKNQGITYNFCKAIKNSKCEIITLLSGDDYLIDNEKLSKQMDFLDNNQDYFAVGTCVKIVEELRTKSVFTVFPNKEYWGKEFRKEDWIRGINFPTHGIMFRNVFNTEEGMHKLGYIEKASRNLDDYTFCFIIFDFGRLFFLDRISYAYSLPNSNEYGHRNYNSMYNEIQKIDEFISTANNVYNLYEKKYDIYNWVKPRLKRKYDILICQNNTIPLISCIKNVSFLWKLRFIWEIILNE